MPEDRDITLRIGHEELVVRQRYETASIANDVLIGLWFVVGSALFFSESTATAGTWLFLLGSIQMLLRPGIRLRRRLHLQRLGSPHAETARDF
ncbi:MULTISPECIES: YrhK family protein [Isoptericola]|uniref:YrhK family protein n=1 Tax=Isoptericola sediminis TaxID=2733572 RepID=A0A849K4D4_9MICO|nr:MULTISPECIES: YrhK family protein [Isoptericola]MDO8143679.1 YrhK family protein [Isoptericola sp. 178]MDO8147576.1 YrhK family protein [Isoptericola sp. b515]MDO8150122.1 YrhK family protein [Isoptericola sp. b408]NNU27260.1 YrhK family protein [Isoptericola sediminis]